MEEFKNFDENIKNKLSEEEFPFDESNWEKAAKMIDDSRKPKTRYGWIALAAVIFVGTSVLLFNTLKDDGKSSQNEIALSSGTKNQDDKTQDETAKNEETKGIAGTKEEVKSETNEVKENNSLKEKESAEVKSETEKANYNSEIENKSKDTGTNTKDAPFSSKVKNTNTNSEIGSDANTASKNKTAKKENKTVKEKNTNDVVVNNKVETKTTEGKISGEIEKKKTETKKTEEKQIAATKNNETTKQLTNQPNNTEKEKQLEATTNPSVAITINSKPDSTIKPIEKTIASAPLDSARKTDSLKTVVETKTETKKDEVKPEPFYKNIISVEAGASYLLGWQNSGSTEGNGFNPIVGVNYSRFFTKNIGVAIGLQYNSVSNFVNNTLIKDSANNLITGGSVSSTTHYDFGVQNDITIINTTKLHYLVAPIKLQFQVKKNVFGIGCNLAYVFSSDNTIETYTERNTNKSQYNVTKTNGYYFGSHNSLDIQLGAFYRRKIYQGLSVNAEFLYGFMDVKNNSFFKSNVTEKNIGFKLTLCYDLFKK